VGDRVTQRLRGERLVIELHRTRALDDVSVALGAGEIVALVGPNGSGKTTLLRTLLGALRPDSGRVTLDGVTLAAIRPRQRARSLTMIGHGSVVDFPMSVRDLVSLGRIPHEGLLGGSSPEDAAAIDEALARVDASALAARSIDTLSAGELQRVQLARAFAQKAAIVLLDEPTANLDAMHELETMRLLRSFTQAGGAVMIAVHDLTLAVRHCDRVVVLDRGRVRADAPAAAAISEALLADVFRIRARVSRDAGGAIDHVLALATVEIPPNKGDQT
jgi:iron complex transport system ATP-binding protein